MLRVATIALVWLARGLFAPMAAPTAMTTQASGITPATAAFAADAPGAPLLADPVSGDDDDQGDDDDDDGGATAAAQDLMLPDGAMVDPARVCDLVRYRRCQLLRPSQHMLEPLLHPPALASR